MLPENIGQQFLLHPARYTPTAPSLPPLPLEEPVELKLRERFLLRSGQLFIALGSALKERALGGETAVSATIHLPETTPLPISRHRENGVCQNGASLPSMHNGVSLIKRTPGE